MGMTVGNLVRQGRELSEGPGSETYSKYYEQLTDDAFGAIDAGLTNADRALSISQREQEGEMRRMGSMRGAGRSPVEEREQMQRMSERAAFNRAQVYTEGAGAKAQVAAAARENLQKFSVAFSADSVSIARSFLDGGSGVRQEYIQSMNRSIENQAAAYQNLGSMWMAQSQMKKAAKEAQKQQTRELIIGGVVAIASAVFTLGGSLGWFAGAGTAATATGTAATATGTAAATTGTAAATTTSGFLGISAGGWASGMSALNAGINTFNSLTGDKDGGGKIDYTHYLNAAKQSREQTQFQQQSPTEQELPRLSFASQPRSYDYSSILGSPSQSTQSELDRELAMLQARRGREQGGGGY
jgi:hypothetical protein